MSHLDLFDLLAKARLTVMGVVVARHNDNIDDAHLLISSYFREAKEAGFRNEQAWAQLFAASVTLIRALVECRSVHHGKSVDESLAEIGLVLAEFGGPGV